MVEDEDDWFVAPDEEGEGRLLICTSLLGGTQKGNRQSAAFFEGLRLECNYKGEEGGG